VTPLKVTVFNFGPDSDSETLRPLLKRRRSAKTGLLKLAPRGAGRHGARLLERRGGPPGGGAAPGGQCAAGRTLAPPAGRPGPRAAFPGSASDGGGVQRRGVRAGGTLRSQPR
jgi:hypothetical protein